MRLANPLLKLDVSGLCWGINRYWEALVSRAQIWAQIEDKHSDLLPSRSRPRTFQNGKKPTLEDTVATTQSDLRRILPHIERTSLLFESPEKSLLLSCELTLDEWTGEPELTPSICISTTGFDNEPTEKIAQDSKKLFQTIVAEQSTKGSQSGAAGGSDVQAILRATDCVLGVLFGANSE
jgi:hypothetical protein